MPTCDLLQVGGQAVGDDHELGGRHPPVNLLDEDPRPEKEISGRTETGIWYLMALATDRKVGRSSVLWTTWHVTAVFNRPCVAGAVL